MEDNSYSEKVLNQHLQMLLQYNANTVMLTIYNVLVSWTHTHYKTKEEYNIVYDRYIKITSNNIRNIHLERMTINTTPTNKLFSEKDIKEEKELGKTLMLEMNRLALDNSIEYLSKLTCNWCSLLPREMAKDYMKGDIFTETELARRLFDYILWPFDYFK